MRLPAVALAVALAALIGSTVSAARTAPALPVPCADIIDHTSFPFSGDSRPEYRYRQVLGMFAVPPAYLPQVVPTGEKPWAYWHKQGLVVRATGEAVTVTVPSAWRKRAAITWGNRPSAVGSLRILGCGTSDSANVGNVYAGGFLLRSASACVPLVFTVGKRSALVRFGVGRRCPS